MGKQNKLEDKVIVADIEKITKEDADFLRGLGKEVYENIITNGASSYAKPKARIKIGYSDLSLDKHQIDIYPVYRNNSIGVYIKQGFLKKAYALGATQDGISMPYGDKILHIYFKNKGR
jgi:hypothetical protein